MPTVDWSDIYGCGFINGVKWHFFSFGLYQFKKWVNLWLQGGNKVKGLVFFIFYFIYDSIGNVPYNSNGILLKEAIEVLEGRNIPRLA